MTNAVKKFLVIAFALFACASSNQVSATTAVDVDKNFYTTGYSGWSWVQGTYQTIAQRFFPMVNNITSIDFACWSSSSYQPATTTIHLCMGSPESGNIESTYDCTGEGNTFVASTTVSITCMNTNNIASAGQYANIPLTGSLIRGTPYYFTVHKNDGNWWHGEGTFKASNIVRPLTTENADYFGAETDTGLMGAHTSFRTQYNVETDASNLAIYIGSPVSGYAETLDSSVRFRGTTTAAESLQIMYGPPNGSPAELITEIEIANSSYSWNFEQTMPNGNWWIWYIAKKGTSTLTATTSLTIAQNSTQNQSYVTGTTTPISSSSAANLLESVSLNCATSPPAYINDPTTLWQTAAPAFLTNGSTTATNTPAFYGVITGTIYDIMRKPLDMLNSVACYTAPENAKKMGTGAGAMVAYWKNGVAAIDSIFHIPIIPIVTIWLIGLVTFFAFKLLPFRK